ncbi:phosphoribosylglycinamide formyltransferase [Curvivirga aplysinae]|uniref:phosphoribosylglycinamide formyltransferase n=1 Tax=Curvivirga aplysinae TaxID=2529852 RepID=UPI0012BD7A16|nr:phosphoribosylglycinamide formyltransferase [Curvivirga aplysinae]MTI10537.1 phosphoribosylglycinamide formyltransferase [Curvivirga aplysinae]
MTKLKVAVAISGGGSNLQAIIDACSNPDYPVEITTVISNKADAYGLERARQANIATKVISHKDYPDRESFDADLHQAILDSGAEFVILAGFMRILTDGFINKWHDKMINIHPSMLPKFRGLDTHARAIEAGESHHGATVHYVRAELDTGPLILQCSEEILENDTASELAARVLVKEHQIYPLALRWVAEGKVSIKDNDAYVNEFKGPILLDEAHKIS